MVSVEGAVGVAFLELVFHVGGDESGRWVWRVAWVGA